jgi:hypothetical protein
MLWPNAPTRCGRTMPVVPFAYLALSLIDADLAVLAPAARHPARLSLATRDRT